MELDVQPTEAVLLLHKATSSQGEWSGFKAGASLDGGLQVRNLKGRLPGLDISSKRLKGRFQFVMAQDFVSMVELTNPFICIYCG